MAELHGTLKVKLENWEQPVKSSGNEAEAEPLVAMSPSETGNVTGVMIGSQDRPCVCWKVKLLIRVLYAGPAEPLVAVSVRVSVFGPDFWIAPVNDNPYPGNWVGSTIPQYAGLACNCMLKGRG